MTDTRTLAQALARRRWARLAPRIILPQGATIREIWRNAIQRRAFLATRTQEPTA